MAKNREMTYSQALNELEKIVAEIESEEVDIDMLAQKIKRASSLITLCRGKLKTAEREVNKVLSSMEEPQGNETPEADNESGF